MSRDMKYGETMQIEINSVDRKGRGCGLMNDRPACAYFCLPGEIIEGKFVGRDKGVKKFQLEQLINSSPHRVTPSCPYAGQCGGCVWQHIDYSYQLELKRDLINTALEAGGISQKISAVEPCPEIFCYRNRMDFCVGDRGEVGLKKPGRWNQYVDLDACQLMSPRATSVLGEFKAWLKQHHVEPWNVFRYTGYARYLVIREGKNSGELMVIIVTAPGELPAKDDLLARLRPLATTIYHGINPEVTDLSLTKNLELLHGEPQLIEKVAGLTYHIPVNSFFQTNTLMAAKLLQTVRQHIVAAQTKKLLDLYCGVGFFAIGLADAATEVYGVELDTAAIDAARDNAAINQRTNIRFDSAAAESLIWNEFAPDTVIVDPPRAGLHPKVIETLLQKKPATIVYVSCKYESFIQDTKQLFTGYQLVNITALDLFPHSPHVELVALLRSK